MSQIASTAGEAAALQALAEVHLARGDTEEANRLLRQALPLARWSAIASAKSDDLPNAHRYLETAERSAKLWEGTAWEAATAEAKAHVAVAAGNVEDARRLIATAIQGFTAAGQPLDTERCRGQAAAW